MKLARPLIPYVTMVLLCAAANAATTVDVAAQANFTFSPPNLTIQVGDSVRFSNPSAGHHNVTADDGSFRCAAGCDGQGGNGDPSTTTWTFTRTFNTAGTFGYHCEVHGSIGGGMHGTITVTGTGPQPQPGSLQFSAASYSVTEGTAKATISVTRTGGKDGAVGVSYSTAGVTATAGSDFTAVSGTLSWADQDAAAKTFQVPITNDTTVEPSETVHLTLASPTGDATLGNAGATLTILDNDSGGGTPPPAAPASLASKSTSGDSVDLTWLDKSSNETLFRVQGRRLSETAFTIDETAGANQHELSISGLDAAMAYSFRVRAENAGGNSAYTDEVIVTTDTTPAPCVADANTLCLGGTGRFRVGVNWRTASGSGAGGSIPLPSNPDSGLFYFFSSNNIEALIKVLNACTLAPPRYWVFFAATTNVEFTLQVTDTSSGKMKTYFNALNHAASPVQDTDGFATCP